MRYITLLLLFFTCCAKEEIADTKQGAVTPTSYKYLALGDSYTNGEGIDSSKSFPVQLASQLTKEGILTQVEILATSGWTTTQLNEAISNNLDRLTGQDLVTLLIGVNNQYQGKSITLYPGEFELILDRAISFSKNRAKGVVVLSIPDYSATPFGQSRPNKDNIGPEIDAYNSIAEDICRRKDVAFFDITTISRAAINNPGLVASDNLHPSGQMYTLWVEHIYPAVKSTLSQ